MPLPPSIPNRRACLIFGAVFVFAGAGRLRAVELQNLVDRSPFSPPGQAESFHATESQATLEFRGMVTDAAGTAFNVFDTSTNKGRWVRHEDKDAALQVKGFDPAHNVLEIEQNGRPARLALKRSTIQAGQSIGAMIPAPAPVAGAGITSIQPGRRGGSLAGNAGAADAVRLKAVAEEIQKRRELRRAALAKASLSANPPSSALPTPGS